MTLKTVFFDLDGTLMDTAHDLANALNKLLVDKNRPPLAVETIKRVVSNGANAMLQLGFDIQPEDQHFAEHRQQLLDFYLEDLHTHTTPFAGIETLIEQLTANNIRWGIVTNKPWAYTKPLMQAFKFASAPVATICPDHVKEKKPNPEGLLLACKQASCNVKEAIYIGDHQRDIKCGKNANMITIAAGYGYISPKENPQNWGADFYVETSTELWPIIKRLSSRL